LQKTCRPEEEQAAERALLRQIALRLKGEQQQQQQHQRQKAANMLGKYNNNNDSNKV